MSLRNPVRPSRSHANVVKGYVAGASLAVALAALCVGCESRKPTEEVRHLPPAAALDSMLSEDARLECFTHAYLSVMRHSFEHQVRMAGCSTTERGATVYAYRDSSGWIAVSGWETEVPASQLRSVADSLRRRISQRNGQALDCLALLTGIDDPDAIPGAEMHALWQVDSVGMMMVASTSGSAPYVAVEFHAGEPRCRDWVGRPFAR